MLITVYMPTRNRLALLQRAVDSVLTQTHQDLELIVVDDGSTDGTPQWLVGQQRRDARLRVFVHTASRGAPSARNLALRSARGAWVTGLDDDDRFLPDRLAGLLQAAQTLEGRGEPFSGLYTREIIESPGRSTTLDKRPVADFRSLFHHNHIGNQIFARREVFLASGLFDEEMPAWQDLDLFLRMAHRFGPARLVRQTSYVLADDDRSDRISKKRKPRLLDAYGRIAAKWPDVAAADRQRLYLQLLAPFYGFPLEWADLQRYFGQRISLEAGARLLKLAVLRWGARHA